MKKTFYLPTLVVASIILMLFVNNQLHYGTGIIARLNTGLHQQSVKYLPVSIENDLQLWSTPQIIQRRKFSWRRMNKTMCGNKTDFVEGTIRVNKETTVPVFLHSPDNDIHISRVLLNGGSWEKDLVMKVVNIMSKYPNSIFIDIGAHIGVFSLTLASLGFRVIAIDCYHGNVERICASSRKAKLSGKISIVYNAVSDSRENLRIMQIARSNIGSIAVVQTKQKTGSDVIPSMQLDDLLEIFDIESAVLKIDVEGHEAKVLKGAENFFKKVNVKFVLTEFVFHKNKDSGAFIEKFMRRHGLHADLEDNISPSNQKQWPWNVQWIKQNT